ncbi:hypothetical protein HSBAA_32770 [Vreelandella sulfidaeris]|uniref:Methionine synthase n=1 Tax=Vreelandella sulfidaeris TaxID=115553 RepID=A0A455UBN8_9GAMM|nr:hypothetical protein HSBAA_32770 [Halomonas sulfidaeris]
MADSALTATLTQRLADRILILDGGMGTMLQNAQLSEEDFRGERFSDWPSDLKGNNDLLALTCPDLVARIHRDYLEAGADIIETNTFNSTQLSQSDYGMETLVVELNRESARLAREVCDAVAAETGVPRYVAGVLGPTSRTASLSPDVNDPAKRNVTFDELRENYYEAAEALIAGGADLIMIETIFDTLNAKAAIYALEELFDDRGERLPVMISGTITDASGRTLSGQTTEAFWNSVRHAQPLSVGLNCALGAEELRPYLEELSTKADTFVSAHPNAGLPNEFGEYDQTPEEMSDIVSEFASSGLVNIIGGCCGSTPEHIRAIADSVRDMAPRVIPERSRACRLSGLEPFNIEADSLFVNVGERTNVTGSARFKRLIVEEDFTTALEVALEQVENGAQVIDINMDEGMLESKEAMERFLNLIAGEPDIARVPIMIDSSKWEIIEAGLKCVQGKAVVNSISLKEGEAAFREQATKCRRFGAAIVVMAFDEEGQADTFARKTEICQRAYRLLVDEIGFPAEDIIFDPNILPSPRGSKSTTITRSTLSRRPSGFATTCPTPWYLAVFPTCRSRSVATTRCAKRFTRRFFITPFARALPWASSTRANSRFMTIFPPSCAKPSKTWCSTAAAMAPNDCWILPINIKAMAAARPRKKTLSGAAGRSISVSSMRW